MCPLLHRRTIEIVEPVPSRIASTLSLLGVLLAVSVLHASLPPPVTHNYTARVWQTQDGLPQETVQAVAQTPDGFLWIGTTGGLLRFDGSRFVTFDRGNTPAFAENSVFTLATGRDGALWIGTEGGGLIRMKDGVFHHFGPAEGLLDGFVRNVLEDRRGVIWIGTDNGLFQLADASARSATRVDATPSIPPIAVHGLAEARDGTLWVGGSHLLAIRVGLVTPYPLVGQYSETRGKTILQTRDGTLWVGTVSGLQFLAPGASHFQRFPGISGTVRTLREISDGTLWIGTIGQGAYTLLGGHLSPVDPSKLPSKTVLSLFEDAERNIWIGTQAGVLRFSRSPVQLVSLPGTADSDFETLSPDRDGTLWVASTRLSHLVNGLAIPTSFPELAGARVRNVFRARDGAFWIGTDGRGLFRLGACAGCGPPLHYTTANGLTNNFIRAILEASNGDLWIATDEGVNRLSHGVLRAFTVADGLAYFSVRAILQDRAGDIWIGTDRGLSHIVPDHFGNARFVSDPATLALAGEKVWALHQTASRALWFGTRDNGLYRYLPGQSALTHYNAEQGLAASSVYSILEDLQHRFWIGGTGGVDVVSIDELERLAVDPHVYLSQRFFAVSAGGELSPLYGGTQPSGVITPEGDAWFPTTRGPVHFLAAEAESSAVPKVFLDQVLADGRTFPAARASPINLNADNRSLEITYGSILLGPQDAVQFQYRLDGFDHDWRYGSNRRVADYTNLPARRYTFRVRAFQGGSGQMTELSLPIVKRQYFFLTWWFLSLCVAMLASLVWWIHRQRLRRVQLAFNAVLDERARLAREMHDTLIQGCAGVSLLLEACSAEADDDSTQHELLDYARTQLASSIDEARQAVWDLRGQQSANFAETLLALTERLDRGSNIQIECHIEGESYPFHAFAMHEVAMASREAIYNALLHASPTRIDVRADFCGEVFNLVIADDGSGFESSGHAPAGHFGLLGIDERIKRLGGAVRVQSAVARGTTVYIQVPKSALAPGTIQRTQPETRISQLVP